MRKVKTKEKLCNVRLKVNLEKGTFMITLAVAKSKGLTRSSRAQNNFLGYLLLSKYLWKKYFLRQAFSSYLELLDGFLLPCLSNVPLDAT